MTLTRALAPLVSGGTYRRGVHLLLGAVLALPYLVLAAVLREQYTDVATRPALLLAAAGAAVLASLPALHGGTRELEIAAARALLGVELPAPEPGSRPALEARVRCALWFGVHLVLGSAIATLLLIVIPVTALAFTPGRHGAWLLVALALLLATVYAVAGCGALATMMAPVLLGPSATERERALAAEARELAGRNRLARDLHDSIGHALTLSTLQAGAARQLFDTDPGFARQALEIIEDTSRTAMEDLDGVLGMLRDRDAPQFTLLHLERLCDESMSVALRVTGPLAAVPTEVSREGYRIVQEALTNAARHAGRVPVTVRVTVADGSLDIEVDNPVPARASHGRRGGRGLEGMRERVDLLRGRLDTGLHAGHWRVTARLPLREAR